MVKKLSEFKHVHFIGIGGISMSGLAEILHTRGFKVSGSDMCGSALTDRLVKSGVDVKIGHGPENITPGIDLVVYTAAISGDNPELLAAESIPRIDRAELLGALLREYPESICVAGTHGKTTTTSMLADIFVDGGLDPTVSVGGILPSIGGNIRIGASGRFITEACEYCDSFLRFNPFIGIILNVDFDHVDYFSGIEQLVESFHRFALNIQPGGVLVVHANNSHLGELIKGLDCRVFTYGAPGAGLWAEGITYDANGCGSFEAIYRGVAIGRVRLQVPGAHNIDNALAAMSAALVLGVDNVCQSISDFHGVQRRFEMKGRFNGVSVVDDYAHHPTEIISAIAAARRRSYNKLWVLFQPHTYSRTRELLPELAAAFDAADEVVLVDIYAAREKDTGDIHSKDLAERISARGKSCRYFSEFEAVEKFLSEACIPNDMLITMGAGNVYLIGEALLDGSY